MEGFKDDLIVVLNDQKDGITIYWYGEDDKKSRSQLWAWLGGHFGPHKFIMPIKLPSGDANGQQTVSNQKPSEGTRSLSNQQ